MKFPFGPLRIDAAEYASHGNAILGIRGSGKTYTATGLAERLFDAGIPFFAFDPIGVWRYLRVPGRGNGYPVVVAGGQAGDLPLTVDAAPELVRAAMQGGVSLVFDLFDMTLSKADWRRIVTAAVRVMLHENHQHGLRHVFIEEAAEFVPQKVLDGVVYAEIEKLARMGGNVRLGYTLINQRSQEVAKAILELCENVFLHRQRGKNALENMDKWLQVAGAAEQKKIIASLPELPQGECWAWLGGDVPQPPVRIKVPAKQSLHPDRRVMRADADVAAVEPVDVAEFVARMQAMLAKPVKATPPPARRAAPTKPKEEEVTKEEADALRAENEDLKRRLAALEGGKPAPASAPAGDIDAIYREVKARLSKEAPALLRVLAIKPEIEVKYDRPTIDMDTTKQPGLLAAMIAEGYFNKAIPASAIVGELKRRGRAVHNTNVYRDLNRLAEQGFLTIEAGSYQAVEGMKVNIVQ